MLFNRHFDISSGEDYHSGIRNIQAVVQSPIIGDGVGGLVTFLDVISWPAPLSFRPGPIWRLGAQIGRLSGDLDLYWFKGPGPVIVVVQSTQRIYVDVGCTRRQ